MNKEKQGFTRRAFLEGAGALAGAALLVAEGGETPLFAVEQRAEKKEKEATGFVVFCGRLINQDGEGVGHAVSIPPVTQPSPDGMGYRCLSKEIVNPAGDNVLIQIILKEKNGDGEKETEIARGLSGLRGKEPGAFAITIGIPYRGNRQSGLQAFRDFFNRGELFLKATRFGIEEVNIPLSLNDIDFSKPSKSFSEVDLDSEQDALIGNLDLGKVEVIETEKINAVGQEERGILEPEIIGEIEIYGSRQLITTQDQEDQLFDYLGKLAEQKVIDKAADEASSSSIGQVKLETADEKREFLLGQEKTLTVIVPKSVWDKFGEGKGVNSLDFPTYVQLHIDLLNREFETVSPQISTKARLTRIIIEEDDFLYQGTTAEGEPYNHRFGYFLPVDTDGFYVFSRDYCEAPLSFLKKVSKNEFGIFIETEGQPRFYLSPGQDSIEDLEGEIIFDQGLCHEFMHILFNLPDEYIFDCHQLGEPFRFREFHFDTGFLSSSSKPSPFLVERLKYLASQTRAQIGGGDVWAGFLGELPKEISLTVKDRKKTPISPCGNVLDREMGSEISDFQVLTLAPDPEVLQEDDPSQTEANYFQRMYKEPRVVAKKISSSEIGGWQKLMQPKILEFNGQEYPSFSPVYIYQSRDTEIIIPAAAFNISKWVGVDNPSYEIGIIGGIYENHRTQAVEFFEGTRDQIGEIIDENLRPNQKYPYAVMNITGTNYWLIWFLS